MIVAYDRVTVDGIPGVHTVVSLAYALDPEVRFASIRLAPGTVHGRWRGGDTLAVPASTCTRVRLAQAVPIDPEGSPA